MATKTSTRKGTANPKSAKAKEVKVEEAQAPEPEGDLLDDLFDDDDTETDGGATGAADAGGGDLLDGIPDDAGEPWMPEAGEGVEGIVADTFTVEDEMNPDDEVPCLTLEDDNGKLWSIRGYRTVLRRELRKRDPQPGDRFAVKYLGPQPIKKGKFAGKDVHVYRTAVRRAVTS